MNPFDIIKTINEKNYLDNLDNKDYNSFIINRFFSLFKETIFYAGEMNKRAYDDGLMQYDFYYHSLPKRKRFSKWFKSDENKDLESVARYYNCSLEKAKNYVKLLNEQDLKQIIDTMKEE